MCNFFSGLITKNKTYFSLEHDDHQKLIEAVKLKDDGYNPNFVRVELLPIDNNIFNHNIKNWKLKVDQDLRPDWFEEKWAEAEMKKEIKKVFRNRFVINKSLDKIEKGRWFVGAGGTVQYVIDGGTVQCVMNGGTVQYVMDGGTVQCVMNGGTVQYAAAAGTVQYVRAGGTVQYVIDGGTVQDVVDGGTVQYVIDGGTVQCVMNGGTVQDVMDGGTVQCVMDGGTVQCVMNGGTVQHVRAGGTVQDVNGICILQSKNAKYKKITNNGIVILKNDKKILVANKDFKLVKVK